jgi:hypothetical protein
MKKIMKKYMITFLLISVFLIALHPFAIGQTSEINKINDKNFINSENKGVIYWKEFDPDIGKYVETPICEKSEEEIYNIIEELRKIAEMNCNPTEKILKQMLYLNDLGINIPHLDIDQYIELAKYLNDNNVNSDVTSDSPTILTPALTTILTIGRPIRYAWTPRYTLIPPFETNIFSFGDYNFTIYQNSYLCLGTILIGQGFLLSTNLIQTASIFQSGFILISLGYIGGYIDFIAYSNVPDEKPTTLAEFLISVNLGNIIMPW